MDKKNKQKKLLPFMLMIAASIVIGATGATVLHTIKLENPIKTPTVEGEVQETPEPKDGSKAAKNVVFFNKGEADVLIRAAISESWTYGEEANKEILPNKAASKEDNSLLLSVAQPMGWIATPNSPISSITDGLNATGGKWIYNSQDGWYYYNRVLPGSSSNKTDAERKTEFLVREVDFSNMEKVKDGRYKTAEYELHITMEVVQASDVVSLSTEAAEALFDKEPEIPDDWDKANGKNKFSCDIKWPTS